MDASFIQQIMFLGQGWVVSKTDTATRRRHRSFLEDATPHTQVNDTPLWPDGNCKKAVAGDGKGSPPTPSASPYPIAHHFPGPYVQKSDAVRKKQGFTFSLSNVEDMWKQVQSLKEVVPAPGKDCTCLHTPAPRKLGFGAMCPPPPPITDSGQWFSSRLLR